MKLPLVGCALIAFVAASAATPKEPLQDLLARMDQSAGSFKGMTSGFSWVTHTAVIDDDAKESGTVTMRRAEPAQVEGRIDFLQPDKRTVVFEKRRAQMYTPKTNTIQIYDLGDKGEQVDRFVMLGFGTSGTELARDYSVRVLGAEALQGQRCTKVELLPKMQEVKNLVSRIELWLPESPAEPYPVQEKIYDKSPGDFRIVTYTNLKINPRISKDALKLKTPAGVKTIYPQK